MTCKFFFAITSLGVIVVLGGCSLNVDPLIKAELNTTRLHGSLGSKPRDFSRNSSCQGVRTVKVSNAEVRTQRYDVYDSMGRVFYIYPDKFIDSVCHYLRLLLEEAKVNTNGTSSSEIIVSLGGANIINQAGGFSLLANVKLKIEIPEIGFSEVAEGSDASGVGDKATAYAIHHALQTFLNDPEVDRYLKCNQIKKVIRPPNQEFFVRPLR